jgi:two-component system phosphate regulon sensor histidine kinase PhoR
VLESTLEEVVRVSSITEDLLLLARSDSGAIRAHPEPVEVVGVVERVVERLGRQASAKGLDVVVESAGEGTAEVDPVLMGQVVWNLVENAIKFTPSGGRVRVRVEGGDERLSLIVEDGGPGFPEDRLDDVFERFFREDRARTHGEETSGVGLGLAIVRAVAEAHSGEAWAENLPGGGGRVEVRLPRARGSDG